MTIIFKPTGKFDLTTDQSSLPDDGLARCKNLRIDRPGKLKTRYGSSKINSTALSDLIINRIINIGSDRYEFAQDAIYKNESSIETSLTNSSWSAIVYNSYLSTTDNIFAVNGTDTKRIEGSTVNEMGIDAPTTAPTIIVGALTGLTGDYNAKYTYCRKESSTVVCESNPSPAASSAVTLADESLDITWTASSDSQVTHVRIYRTEADGSTYYHDQDIAIGTVNVDTNTTDTALGSEAPDDHDRPPDGTVIFGPTFNGTIFIIYDNLLYYCKPKQPEYWPTTYFIEVSTIDIPLKAGCFFNGQPYVASKRDIHLIQGTGHDSFFPHRMSARTGTVNQNCFLPIAGLGIIHVGNDGIYLYSSGLDTKMSYFGFDPIFHGETINGVPYVDDIDKSWLIQFEGNIYFGYKGPDDTYAKNVIIFNIETKRSSYYLFPMDIVSVYVDEENNRVLAGDNAGYVWEIEHENRTSDAGTDISWEAESKEFTQQTRAHFPRWVKYDVDASDVNCSATGTLLLDGSTHQTHTITGNRITKRRLVATGNGELMSHRISGIGPVSIYGVESE